MSQFTSLLTEHFDWIVDNDIHTIFAGSTTLQHIFLNEKSIQGTGVNFSIEV